MEIEIVYETWDNDQPVRLNLAPEVYFDPVEPGGRRDHCRRDHCHRDRDR